MNTLPPPLPSRADPPPLPSLPSLPSSAPLSPLPPPQRSALPPPLPQRPWPWLAIASTALAAISGLLLMTCVFFALWSLAILLVPILFLSPPPQSWMDKMQVLQELTWQMLAASAVISLLGAWLGWRRRRSGWGIAGLLLNLACLAMPCGWFLAVLFGKHGVPA